MVKCAQVDGQADRELFHACKNDIKTLHCYGNGMNSEDIIECLRERREEINDAKCKALLFREAEIEAVDNQLDTVLVRACRQELETLCAKAPAKHKLKCLKNHRQSADMSGMCLEVVQRRIRETAHDVRLRPGIMHACKMEMKKHCQKELQQIRQQSIDDQRAVEGAVLYCLRGVITDRLRDDVDSVASEDLTQACINEVHALILESEIDMRVDIKFYDACKTSIHRHCGSTLTQGATHQTVDECIRAAYYARQIDDPKCRAEMERRTSEELSDIELDPELHHACAIDAQQYCRDVPSGRGRIITCLLMALNNPKARVADECRAKLMNRQRLWEVAHLDGHVSDRLKCV